MRIDKFIADTTPLSRAQVKQCIRAGEVTVDGQIVYKPNQQLDPNLSIVTHQSIRLSALGSRYFAFHKPTGVVCSHVSSDASTVFDWLKDSKQQRAPNSQQLSCSQQLSNPEQLQIVGRLDKDASGLVLLTDDGNWNHRISSPKSGCKKIYRVTLAEPLYPEVVQVFLDGIVLRGEEKKTLSAELEIVDNHTAILSLQEGKYHQVKRMFAAVGNHVIALHRFQIGKVQLDDVLSVGHYRPLTKAEVNSFGA